MFELIKFLLHVIDIVLLSGTHLHASFSSILHAIADFHSVSILHLLQQVAYLALVDGSRVYVVERSIHFLGLNIEVLKHLLKFTYVLPNLI